MLQVEISLSGQCVAAFDSMRLIGFVKGLCIFFHQNVLKSSCLASLEDEERQAHAFSSSQLYCPLISTEMLIDEQLSGWVVAARRFARPLYTHGFSILCVPTPSLQITHLFRQAVLFHAMAAM